MRYGRCQGADCGRKWHRLSMLKVGTRSDLLDQPREAGVGETVGFCPACGAACHAETGLMDEADPEILARFKAQSAAAAKALMSPVANYRLEDRAVALGMVSREQLEEEEDDAD